VRPEQFVSDRWTCRGSLFGHSHRLGGPQAASTRLKFAMANGLLRPLIYVMGGKNHNRFKSFDVNLSERSLQLRRCAMSFRKEQVWGRKKTYKTREEGEFAAAR